MTATNAVIVIASAAGLLRFSYATISMPYAAKSDCKTIHLPDVMDWRADRWKDAVDKWKTGTIGAI